MKKHLSLPFIPLNTNLALLLLRLWLGFSLFIRHGIEKFSHFSTMKQHFPDPLHVGTGLSLSFALVSDGICSVLVMAGLFSRIATLVIVLNLLVVFVTLHHLTFGEDHAELVYLYLGGFLALLAAGPGKFSLDHKFKL